MSSNVPNTFIYLQKDQEKYCLKKEQAAGSVTETDSNVTEVRSGDLKDSQKISD